MQFRPDSLRWAIENYDFLSKYFQLIRSPKFPLNERESRKWHVTLNIPKLKQTNGGKYSLYLIRTKDSKHESGDIYIEASVSFETSTGKIYNCCNYTGNMHNYYLEWQLIGEKFYKELAWDENSNQTLILHASLRVLNSIEHICTKLSDDKTLRDVTIYVGNRSFRAHKAILAARSKVFASMFSSKSGEQTNSTVKIKDLKPETVKVMLDFIYTGKVDYLDFSKSSGELLDAAEKFDLKRLKELCIEEMYRSLEYDYRNVAKILEVADTHSIPDLKEAALKSAIGNRQSLRDLVDFKTLMSNRPYLMTELINIGENTVDNIRDINGKEEKKIFTAETELRP